VATPFSKFSNIIFFSNRRPRLDPSCDKSTLWKCLILLQNWKH